MYFGCNLSSINKMRHFKYFNCVFYDVRNLFIKVPWNFNNKSKIYIASHASFCIFDLAFQSFLRILFIVHFVQSQVVSSVSYPSQLHKENGRSGTGYKGSSCTKAHLVMYMRKMYTHTDDQCLLIHYFQDSLNGANLKWYIWALTIFIFTLLMIWVKHSSGSNSTIWIRLPIKTNSGPWFKR